MMYEIKRRQDLMDRRVFLTRLGMGAVGAGLFLAGCGSGDGNSNGITNDTNGQFSNTLARSNEQMRAVIAEFLRLNPTPIYNLPPQEARQRPTVADAVRNVLIAQGRSTAPEPVANVQDTTVPGPAGALPIRVYTPSGTGPFPVLVYFHGGGWVIGSIDVYDSSCRALANAAQCVVISVEYRKGPENRFPAAHEDAYAATQYVLNNAAQFGGDPNRVAVSGESAGGNMASAVCILARERGGKIPVYQLLIYPVAGNDLTTESYNENADAVPLSRPLVQYFLNYYLPDPAVANNPLINLLGADVTGLPPATVITDEIDPLRSEGQAYADKLRNAGITVRSRNFEDVTHEFFGTGAVVDTAREAVTYAAEGLRTVFNPTAG